MQFCTVVRRSNGEVVGAELACSVREENRAQRESYSADWSSVRLETRPQDRQTQDMKDESRKETLYRQWQVRTLGQACPSGVFRVGTVERGVREHQLLPRRSALPLPIFIPAELGVRLGRGWATPANAAAAGVEEGPETAKRTVDEITRDLPPIKTIGMDFTSKALGRSTSVEAQRG